MIMIILIMNNVEGTYNTAFPTEYNSAVGSGQGPQDFAPQANPTVISSLRLQASSSQAYTATSSGHGVQASPTQASVAACSILTLQSIAVQTDPTSCTVYGAQSFLVGANPTMNSSYGTELASSPANPSTCLSYKPKGVPAQAHATANSAHHSQVIPIQSNSAATSSHGPNDLLGQAVCGTLDGTFDAGYLLTVRVPNTGHVLKGLVFDPHLCVPISADNDIAPLLPMAAPNGTPSSVVEALSQTLVSVPIHPVPMSFAVALPLQIREPAAPPRSVNHLLVTSMLPHTAPQLSTNKVAPNDKDPQLSTNKVAPKGTDSRPLEVPHALQEEVRAKTLRTLSKSLVNNANQESPPAAAQHVVINKAQAEDSLHPPAVNKETSQTTLDVPSNNRHTNAVEYLTGEQSMHQVKESLTNFNKASGANEEMHQTEDSSGNMVEIPGGDHVQHCLEESLQGKVQQLSDQPSDEKGQLCGEPKSEAGEQNHLAPPVPQESTS